MGFDPASGTLLFHQPLLPEFLDEVVLRGISLPQGRLDVLLRRVNSEVVVQVLEREGNTRVTTTY
jgi:hypothetical protein